MSDFERIRDEMLARQMPADAADKVAKASAARIARNKVSAALQHVNTARPVNAPAAPEQPKVPGFVIGTRG